MAADVLVILQQAINKEEDRCAYYEDAAQRACNPLAQQTFLFLAKEESRHADFVRAYYEKMEKDGSWPDPSMCDEACRIAAEDIRGIFADAQAGIDGDVTCDAEIAEAYSIAMQFEREAITFFSAQLEAATDPNAKAFYEALVAAERTHLKLLAETDDYLNDTEKWFFDAEQWLVEG
jgi:rubrerythrin